MRKLISALTAFVMAAFIVDSAWAQRTWDGGGGNGLWNTPANWSGDTLPTSADAVIFPAMGGPYTVTMDANPGSCLYLDMHANATLSINASRRLDIYDNGSNNSVIDGQVQLAGSGATLRLNGSTTVTPKTSAAHRIVIRGQHNDAVIDSDNGSRTLTLSSFSGVQARVAGALTVASLVVENDGAFIADDGTTKYSRDTLRFASSVTYNSGTSTGTLDAVRSVGSAGPAFFRFDVSALLPCNTDFSFVNIGANGGLGIGVTRSFSAGVQSFPMRIYDGAVVTLYATCP